MLTILSYCDKMIKRTVYFMMVIKCKCGARYPDDMAECPTCGRNTRDNSVVKPTPVKHKYNNNITDEYIAQLVESRRYNNQTPRLKPCELCGHQISSKAESCPHCGNPTGVHVCPKCNSINTRVITGTSKAASIFLWGAFAANKVVSKYECKDCGHKF